MPEDSKNPTAPDRAAEHYTGERGESYVRSRQSNRKQRGFALNFAYFKPYVRDKGRVLDFGCGNGGMLPYISEYANEVEGLEVNPTARAMAKEFEYRVYPGLEEIPADQSYDVIVSNHVLEHIPNVQATMGGLFAHLKPGGLFVTKLPYDDIRASHQRTWDRQDIDHHIHTWTPRLFANVLFDAGFEVSEARVITSAWNGRLFPLRKVGLESLAFRAFAMIKHRRQLFAVGKKPLT